MKIKNVLYLTLAMVIAFAGGAITMAQVNDWHDVDRVHHEVQVAIDDLTRLQGANGYHMGGHAARAKVHLIAAEQELRAAVDFVRNGR
ncbi:MAG: hypothetical protein WCF17_22050 [Terracidiphilus sp.]